jgi:hypothetical protein
VNDRRERLDRATRRAVLVIWVVVLATYILFSPVVFLGGLAFPYVMVRVMAPATAVSALLLMWRRPRIAAVLVAATILQGAIALVALSAAGSPTTVFGRPSPIQIAPSQTAGVIAWLAGTALPLALSIWVVRRMRGAAVESDRVMACLM